MPEEKDYKGAYDKRRSQLTGLGDELLNKARYVRDDLQRVPQSDDAERSQKEFIKTELRGIIATINDFIARL